LPTITGLKAVYIKASPKYRVRILRRRRG
jgi:hypothetical protein